MERCDARTVAEGMGRLVEGLRKIVES